MDHPPFMTWYVSRRVRMPLHAAATALDALTRQRSGDERASPARLTDALVATPSTSLPGLARRLRGRLTMIGLGRPVPVELELSAWSHRESELALRPIKRPSEPRAERYFTTATSSLEVLTADINAITATPEVPQLRRAS